MSDWFSPCFNELLKIAVASEGDVQLSSADKRKQMLQFAGLGAASAPLISGAKNLITHGKLSPFSSKARWLPAQVMAGTLAGGAVPAAQHLLARSNVDKVRRRQAAEQELKTLAPEVSDTTLEQTVEIPSVPIPLKGEVG